MQGPSIRINFTNKPKGRVEGFLDKGGVLDVAKHGNIVNEDDFISETVGEVWEGITTDWNNQLILIQLMQKTQPSANKHPMVDTKIDK